MLQSTPDTSISASRRYACQQKKYIDIIKIENLVPNQEQWLRRMNNTSNNPGGSLTSPGGSCISSGQHHALQILKVVMEAFK